MKICFKSFLGAPIRDKMTKGLLGRVSGLVVNPVNGEIMAVYAHPSKKLIVPTKDISRIQKSEVWVEHPDALCPPTDIVRTQEVIEQDIPIQGNQVNTVSRQRLGTVIDFELETNGWIMTKLDVAKKILNIPTQRKLIDTNQIVRITQNEITVQDVTLKTTVKKKNKEVVKIVPSATTSCQDK